MLNPIVIDPPGFDQDAGRKECREWVEKCGGLMYGDGEPNYKAASGADPGVCSCPACGENYWCWGNVQRCVVCAFEYPTDWWPMYSWGSQAARRNKPFRFDDRMTHPYYRYGFEHPTDDPWKTCHTEVWRAEIRAAFQKGTP